MEKNNTLFMDGSQSALYLDETAMWAKWIEYNLFMYHISYPYSITVGFYRSEYQKSRIEEY